MNTEVTIDMQRASQLLKLLGDQTRLTMMKLLQSHECCVCEFVEIFKMSQPAISQHLRKLRDIELVKEERKGNGFSSRSMKIMKIIRLFKASLNNFRNRMNQLLNWKHKGFVFVVNKEEKVRWFQLLPHH